MKNEYIEIISLVEKEYNRIIEFYEGIVDEADKMSEILKYDSNKILKNIFPSRADERRHPHHFSVWLSDNQHNILDQMRKKKEEEKTLKDRSELIESLNLTDEQKTLLNL